jgi:hypothetical protein
MATADEFLDAAAALVDHPSPGRGHWRRSISTAYYAAFHCVVEAACTSLFASEPASNAAKQWFEHASVAEVAAALASIPGDATKGAAWLAKSGAAMGF